MQLSIVIPCYNVEKYISRCLDSILSQKASFKYEIILVNDASTDRTLDILLSYSRIHSNIQLINKNKNEKLSAARATGIENAIGKYIMNVDSDDYLLPNCFNTIWEYGLKFDYDICIFNLIVNDIHNNSKLFYGLKEERDFNLSIRKDIKSFYKSFSGAAFGKLFRSKILKELIYSKYSYNMGEDLALNFELFNRSKFIKYIPIPIYCYCYNSSSIIHAGFNQVVLDTNNNWVSNIKEVILKKSTIDPIILKITYKRIERYTIGLLFQIKKQPKELREILWYRWLEFFNQTCFAIPNWKKSLYDYIFKIKPIELRYYLIFLTLFQFSPLTERVYKAIKVFSK